MSQDSAEVNVDLDGLNDFVGSLRGTVAFGFQEGASRTLRMVTAGASFAAAVPGGEMLAARLMLSGVLQRAYENVADKAMGAAKLAEAIARIIANYRDADQSVLQQLGVIQEALADTAAQTVAAVQNIPRPLKGPY